MTTKKKTILSILLFALVSCTTPLSAKPPELVIHEYLLVGPPDISTDRLKFQFAEGDQEQLQARTEAYRDFRGQVATYNNSILEPFGYSLKHKQSNDNLGTPPYLDLYHGNELVEADIQFMTPISVNASKTDFIAGANLSDGQTYIFTREGFTKRSWAAERQPYVYVGDRLLSTETIAAADQKLIITVYLDDQQAYQSQIYAGRPTYGFTEGPWSYNGHWALVILDGKLDNQGNLEMLNRVVQDGHDVNTQYKYEQSFQFAVLDERPFYFFQRGGKIGISFDGQEIAKNYEEIPHYNCCSSALLNPGISMNMIWFFARRGKDWYYVEAYVPINEKK